VIKYTKDFIVQFREVRRTARRVTLTARTSLPPTDRRPSGLWSRADAAASLSFPETFFAQVFRAARERRATESHLCRVRRESEKTHGHV
jgi:hypothetical protein